MKYKGWKQVFKFTYLQTLKSKAYIISTIIIAVCVALMAVGLNFLPGLLAQNLGGIFGGESGEKQEFNINALYIFDNSDFTPPLDFSFMEQEYNESGMEVVMIGADELESVTSVIRENAGGVALIEINRHGSFFNLLLSRPESELVVTTEDCNALISRITDYLWENHYLSIGVHEENLSDVNFGISSQITIAGDAPRNEIAAIIANTALPMVSSLILFMFIIMYGQLTAQSIAMEKTSRVMETLLTSVRPLAIILGKILGMGLASLTQFFALALSGALISAAVAPFGTLGQVFGMVEIPIEEVDMQMFQTAFSEAFANFNALSIVWIIVVFILGFIFYSLIAGLFGASVSRVEDLQAAMQPMALIGVLGFYLAYVSPVFNMAGDEINMVQRISYYLPLSSPFALPAVIISGEMDTLGIIVSMLILAGFCLLMLLFVSRVYEAIIMHTGNRIKLGAMFKMAKKK